MLKGEQLCYFVPPLGTAYQAQEKITWIILEEQTRSNSAIIGENSERFFSLWKI